MGGVNLRFLNLGIRTVRSQTTKLFLRTFLNKDHFRIFDCFNKVLPVQNEVDLGPVVSRAVCHIEGVPLGE